MRFTSSTASIRVAGKSRQVRFGAEPPPYNRRFLESRLAYRVQELAFGSLKPETVARLEALGEGEIESKLIGQMVMEGLAGLDDVAFVRYASVYRNFREARDFEQIVGELEDQEGAGGA